LLGADPQVVARTIGASADGGLVMVFPFACEAPSIRVNGRLPAMGCWKPWSLQAIAVYYSTQPQEAI